MKRLVPLLIVLLLLPSLAQLSSGCLHMGSECPHGGLCPVHSGKAEAVVCHTAQAGEGHEGHEPGCALSIGCDDAAAPDLANPLEAPFMVNHGDALEQYPSREWRTRPSLALAAARPFGLDRPPEYFLLS